MPHSILNATWLAPQVRQFLVHAPHVTRNSGPGQFVIVRSHPDAERIPLTICHADRAAGTITLIVQAVGASTTRMCALETGETFADVAGPLGKPTHIEHVGHAVIVGGGVGTAVIFPQAAALKDRGNRLTAIIGGRSKPYVILEEELAPLCDRVLPCTDDGSHGFHGFVTQRVHQLIDESIHSDPVNLVLCAGPVPMMRAVADLTRPYEIPTVASLNPIMVDGTGMCGGCRVNVGGKTLFACVDGPEFDAHAVDFKSLADRLTAYKTFETHAMHRCHSAGAHA
jgi:ferredoxin/flavodoxin---NADP+ reductase